METLSLYPRGNILKNLVTDFKKKYNVTGILVDWDYESNPVDKTQELGAIQKPLYDYVIKKFWFSEIAFDSIEEFIWHFNNIFNSNISRYQSLFIYHTKLMGEESTTHNDTTNITKERTGNNTDTYNKSENHMKGVTTVSNVESNNEGSKLSRSNPNETLNVEGTSKTTVTDSGKDEDTFNGTNNGEYTANDTESYDKEITITVNKVTPETYDSNMTAKNIFNQFANLFYNLFLEVINV